MPPRVETSETATNSVKESFPGLPDEPHPLNCFPFFKPSIGKLKLVSAEGAMDFQTGAIKTEYQFWHGLTNVSTALMRVVTIVQCVPSGAV